MILYRWRGTSTNFGDELNTILWPRLLPDFFDDDPSVAFLGIGSVLDRRHPPDRIKLVAGAGYAGYEGKPYLDPTWVIHWVRGHRTAAKLGLPASLAAGDPAIMVPQVFELTAGPPTRIGFMPHFETAAAGNWTQATALAGLSLIDPRDPPWRILQAIGGCKLMLSEALHGAIVADALRVPWIAIRPMARIHHSKWLDWTETMGVQRRFEPLAGIGRSAWASSTDQADQADRAERAAAALWTAASAAAQLSDDRVLSRTQSRMMDLVQTIRTVPLPATKRFVAGGSGNMLAPWRRFRLPASN